MLLLLGYSILHQEKLGNVEVWMIESSSASVSMLNIESGGTFQRAISVIRVIFGLFFLDPIGMKIFRFVDNKVRIRTPDSSECR